MLSSLPLVALVGLIAPTTLPAWQSARVTPTAVPAYDAAVAKAAVAALADELEKTFVFPDIAKRYATMLRSRLAAGHYDAIADREQLAKAVTDDLQAVAPDGHLAMRASAGPRSAPRPSNADGSPSGLRPVYPPLMEQAGLIAPSIAYVRFNAFMGRPDVLTALTAFLDADLGAKTLIIDARTHRGGGLDEMDVLFPRLFAKPVTVMTMDTRASVARERGGLPFRTLVRVNAPDELFRAEHRVTPAAPISAWATAKVYVLTSSRTASAAEHMTMALKATRRATIVGDTTAGAGNYGGTIDLPGGYTAFVPIGRSYFPGGEGWEGTGIAPDIKVAPERALVEVLIREGVAPLEAEALSATHPPQPGSVATAGLKPCAASTCR